MTQFHPVGIEKLIRREEINFIFGRAHLYNESGPFDLLTLLLIIEIVIVIDSESITMLTNKKDYPFMGLHFACSPKSINIVIYLGINR